MDTALITGTSNGVGKAAAKKFLSMGVHVIGSDIKEATIEHDNYEHYVCDVSNEKSLPDVKEIKIILSKDRVRIVKVQSKDN